MTYDPAKPRYTLKLADKSYELEGSFDLIEAVEYALKDNIINIMMRCASMPVSDMAKLIASILTNCVERTAASTVGQIIWNDIGVTSDAYALLCLNIYAFLSITIAKPGEREETAKKMGELLGEQNAKFSSPSTNTSASA